MPLKTRIGVVVAAALTTLAGCAAAPVPRGAPILLAAAPASGAVGNLPIPPVRPREATMTLDQIEPHAALPPGTGSATGKPPLQSVYLYAQAQLALHDGDRVAAIDLLEKAVELDPRSYELHHMLAQLYRMPVDATDRALDFTDRSIAMLEKAAAIEPDHLDLQSDLGRQYLAKGDTAKALLHLRLALLTHQYSTDPAAASVAEFFLGNLLRKQGYEAAALQVYQRLATHLESPRFAMRSDPLVRPLIEHADAINAEVADLLVRNGKIAEAVAAYEQQIAQTPGNFELHTRLVRLLLSTRKNDPAVHAAEDAVVQFRANSDSVALLGEACLTAGRPGGAVGSLQALHKQRPNDHSILYALATLLHTERRDAEAAKLLAEASAADPGDFQIVQRQFTIMFDAGDRTGAARLLVHASAAAPDHFFTLEVEPLWSQLSRPSPRGRLRWTDLKTLAVPDGDEKAKSFWMGSLAGSAHRDGIAHEAMMNAASPKGGKPFVPAYRDLLDQLWERDDLDDAQREQQSAVLVKQAAEAVGEPLANELRALALSHAGKPKEAALAFSQAVDRAIKPYGADLMLDAVNALRSNGNDVAADSLSWKIISDHPMLNDGYLELYLSSLRRNLESQAENVMAIWLRNMPDSVAAWRMQAILYQRAGRIDAAESILARVFKDHPDNFEAIAALNGFYERTHHSDRFLAALQAEHKHHPDNFQVDVALVEALSKAHDMDGAARAADAARAAAGNDPDLLYSVSELYNRAGRKEASEDVLAQVLKLEPDHAGACNDLGYAWTEAGRKLAEAEQLIRKGLDAEPDNSSFLDSMGWVLYKRGRFAEARPFLDRAIGKSDTEGGPPSHPEVLNHRGDLLYRLGDKQAAGADWKHAAERIAAMEDGGTEEMKALRGQLLEKSKKLTAGEAVDVSPAEEKFSN